ncbi:MAG: autotransporter-associated beta strand repeat-containing protein [Undibacterium sp.]|nr:autotransporter-associated beta strand repeat-containing protein [Opitutaceae bacterium]
MQGGSGSSGGLTVNLNSQFSVLCIGSSWTSSGSLGVRGAGSAITVGAGGGLTSATASQAQSYVDYGSSVVVIGAGPTWNNPAGLSIYTGSLRVDDSATATTGGTALAACFSDNIASATVQNGGRWDTVGLAVGGSGAATLTINSGGAVTATGDTSIGANGTATLGGAGSQLNSRGGLTLSGGATLTVSSGAVHATSTGFNPANSYYPGVIIGVGTVTLKGSGSTWTDSGYVDVGYLGAGTLNIQNGATATFVSLTSGILSGDPGTVLVAGAGSRLTTTDAHRDYLGFYGGSTVTVGIGGRYDAASMTPGYQNRGQGTTLTITGSGSKLNVTDQLTVGNFGDGTFVVSAGAVANTGTGAIAFGSPNGAGDIVGQTMITGAGSHWNITGSFGISTYYDPTAYNLGTLTIAEGGKVTVSTGEVTVARGGTLNIGTGGLAGTLVAKAVGNAGKIIFNHTDDLTFAAAISDYAWSAISGALTKTGGGTLTLTGASTYTGITTLSGGAVAVSSLGDGGNTSSVGQSDNSAGNLVLDGGTPKYTGSATSSDRLFTVTGNGGTIEASATSNAPLAFTSTGALALSGSGNRTLTLTGTSIGANILAAVVGDPASGKTSVVKTGAGKWALSGTNTFTGGVSVSAGTLRATKAGALGTGGSALTVGGGTVELANNTGTNFDLNPTLAGSATISPSRTSNGAAFTQTLGTLSIGAQTLTVAHGTNFSSNNTRSLTFGATTFTGDAFFTLNTTNGTAVGVTTLGALNDSGTARTITKNGAGTLTPATAATSLVTGTTITLNAGRLKSNQTTALGVLATVNLCPGVTLGVGASQTFGALNGTGGTVALGANTLTVGHAANNLTSSYAGAITGTGGLIKAGSGTFTLAGAHTYSGATTVTVGKLLADGALASSAVAVASGASFGGRGTFAGLATFASGAHLSPGDSVGTLTFNAGLPLMGGSIFDFQLGVTRDQIAIAGGRLTGPASGLVTLNFANSGGFTAATYSFTNYTSAVNSTNYSATSFTLGSTISGYPYNLALIGNNLELTASAIPEPSTYAALSGVAALGLAGWRRRRAVRPWPRR